MIRKEYTILHNIYDRKQIELMRSWCNQYIGNAAKSCDSVTESHPWIMIRHSQHTMFCFCKEDDAAAFSMRWL